MSSTSVCAELLNELKRLDRLLDETQVTANKYYSITTKFQQFQKDGIEVSDKELDKLIRSYRDIKSELNRVDKSCGISLGKLNRLENEKRKRKEEHSLVGGKRFKGDTSLPKGRNVAARISKDRDYPEEWILASIVSFDEHKQIYEVEDADPELVGDENDPIPYRRHYFMPPNRIIPLPGLENKSKEIPKGTEVLAMFPETTSFYRAIVEMPPKGKKNPDYILKFDDDDDDSGQTPLRRVDPNYVLSRNDSLKS